jgi:hypothetical protein
LIEGKSLVRRRARRKGKKRAWWLPYRWEFVAVLALVAGVFLILGRGVLRTRLLAFLSVSAEVMSGRLAKVDALLGAFFTRLTVADVLGTGLVLLALGLVLWRIRQRILDDPVLAALACPRCGGPIHRIHRTSFHRLISRSVPVRRYGCGAAGCGWKGLRVGRGHRGSH